MKEILDILWRAQEHGDLRFLIIGGRGLEAHGYQRFTKDLDCLIATDQLPILEGLLERAGFERIAENSSFNRYRHRSLVYEPMDVMKVNQSTFDKMWAGSVAFDTEGLSVRAPGVSGYIALKLHAIRCNPERRFKDLSDLVEILASKNPVPSLDELRELCERYGPPGILADLERHLKP